MKKLDKIYLEITNACNLSCSFCPRSNRAIRSMDEREFSLAIDHCKYIAESVYFHVKGEPLLHDDLGRFIDIADEAALPVLITTNGTLLERAEAALSGKRNLKRLNISLHSLSTFPTGEMERMTRTILDAATRISSSNRAVNPSFLVSLRLWTKDDVPSTLFVLELIEDWARKEKGTLSALLESRGGLIVRPGLAIHMAKEFVWPSLDGTDFGKRGFCRALRDQAGILSDGTVVPCCLDGEGVLALGNIFESTLEEILSSARAREIYDSFTNRTITEPLCRRCGYRTRFN
jgi:radical SAM protein with 4Fe4S-binding SPASM domain